VAHKRRTDAMPPLCKTHPHARRQVALLTVLSLFLVAVPAAAKKSKRTALALGDTTPEEGMNWLKANVMQEGWTYTRTGLQYKVVDSGPTTGYPPDEDTLVVCDFVGTLTDGTEVETTRGKGPATLKPSQVMTGLREAMLMMRAGDKWELALPSEMAFGKDSHDKVPAGSVLLFTLELLEVHTKPSIIATMFDNTMHIYYPDWYKNGQYASIVLLMLISLYLADIRKKKGIKRGKVVTVEEATDKANPRVYLKIQVGDGTEPDGLIKFTDGVTLEIELFSKIVPRTAENFRALCTGEKGACKTDPELALCYRGSSLFRIYTDFLCQAGDITKDNGKGGESIYGPAFDDEWDNGYMLHKPNQYLLTSAAGSAGENLNQSQFYFMLSPNHETYMDGRNVVFGRVVNDKGKAWMDALGKLGDKETGEPAGEITIVDCGQMKSKKV